MLPGASLPTLCVTGREQRRKIQTRLGGQRTLKRALVRGSIEVGHEGGRDPGCGWCGLQHMWGPSSWQVSGVSVFCDSEAPLSGCSFLHSRADEIPHK